ncbi:hypothetical protein EIL87_25820 [Saccharopolyspora rhizosphaerae]|uniref:Uncharacterized protein n=1 Tax=Saccharopolyspora rhizosphaerae TaxID=2492662 RepID=A0A3R8Q4R3_9PSEU|nr:hypothetical protein [Saccharopolyspora rhizosphaerae]RRO13068.1 hypothetical protein EIL87_25820 [Saccharopolyspora rhizosphaerae]
MTDVEQRVDAFGRPEQPPEPPQPPQTLQIARWLWIASVLVGVVQAFVQLLDRERLITELRQLQPEMTQTDLDAAANSGIMFTFMFKALTLMVYVLLSRRMLEARQWARVTLTVFGGFGALNAVVTVLTVTLVGPALIKQLTGMTVSGVDVVFAVLVAAVEVAAIVFMYRPESNRYVRENRGRRSQPPRTVL